MSPQRHLTKAQQVCDMESIINSTLNMVRCVYDSSTPLELCECSGVYESAITSTSCANNGLFAALNTVAASGCNTQFQNDESCNGEDTVKCIKESLIEYGKSADLVK